MTLPPHALLGGCAPILWQFLLAVMATTSAGCRQRAELTIKDSEGRPFVAQCAADRSCSVTLKSDPTVVQPGTEGTPIHAETGKMFRLHTTGRVVGVCGTSGSDSVSGPSDCRPVVCEADRDCPAAEGLHSGVCISRLCTEPSHPLGSDDAVMLCLAGTGIGSKTAVQVERLALGLNCGNPCRVPKPCRQP